LKEQSVETSALADNPLLVTDGLPRFDRIRAEHVVPAVRKVLADASARFDGIEKTVDPTWKSAVESLDELNIPFQYAWSPVSHLLGVQNSPELRTAHEEVLPEVVMFSLRVGQSEPLYRVLKGIKEGPAWSSLSAAQKRIVDHKILDAELSGIGLSSEKRERFNAIAQELSQLSTDFSNHVLDATKAFSITLTNRADVEGLPPSLLRLASHSHNTTLATSTGGQAASATQAGQAAGTEESGPWRFTLEAPSYGPFLQHSRRRDLREKMYRAYVTRAASSEWDNTPLITKILSLRAEEAQLLGFSTYAELSLAKKMAPNVETVSDMFKTLRQASWSAAHRELDEVRALAAEAGAELGQGGQPVMNWDVAFWSERLREKKFQFTDEELRPYFPLESVLKGLFGLAERIFGIHVSPADGEAPVWHKDVRFFRVTDESGKQVAAFYLDPYSRPENKRGGAWMDDCLGRRLLRGRLQLPVAHLICNSTPPAGGKPSLMTFREVETLFHEFGHGLQHMLTTVDYADAAGINGVEWDAVELPSQFMENWCYHRPTLMGLSAHYETGRPLPEELFEKLCAARTFQAGLVMLRQLLFGMTDMALHHGYSPAGGESAFELQRQISEQTSVMPLLPEDRSLCAFTHIFSGGYAAGYYSYKWAEVLSADAFSAFEEVGLENEAAIARVGRRFRDTVLAQGGSRHPMEVFKDFRGREPNPQALLRHNGLA
jgi:oligopeptidase A